MPLDGQAQPHPKQTQLARSPAGVGLPKHRGQRRFRVTASPDEWRRIVAAKMGRCRCETLGGCTARLEWHHVVPRAHGGGDVQDCIVPLCSLHHERVTRRDQQVCRALLANLTDAEYAYLVGLGGECAPERFYGIVYERVR